MWEYLSTKHVENSPKTLHLLILASQKPLDVRNTWEETLSYMTYSKGGVANVRCRGQYLLYTSDSQPQTNPPQANPKEKLTKISIPKERHAFS